MQEKSNEYRVGINHVIKRKRMATWFPVLWMSLGLLFLIFGFDQVALVVLLAGAFANGYLTLLWITSSCPRCDNKFYSIPSTPGFLWDTKKCRHCGLGLSTDNASKQRA